MKLERSYSFDLTSVCDAERKFQFQWSNKKKIQLVGWRGKLKYFSSCYPTNYLLHFLCMHLIEDDLFK